MRRAFTLIELLVVVAIIALLIAIILPALNSARRSAQDAQCLSNARQIGLAMHMYATDENGMFPAHRSANPRGPDAWGWNDKLLEQGYLATADAYYCPLVDIWESRVTPGLTYPVEVTGEKGLQYIPYGFNAYWLGLDPYTTGFELNPMSRNYTLFDDVQNPSDLMVVADSQLSVTDAWGSTLWYFKRKSPTALEGVSDRHNGKAMLSFADGHAAAEDAVVVNGIDDPADIDQGKSFWIPNNRWYVPF